MKVKFKKRVCKVVNNKDPYYKEVELRVFEYEGIEYGFAYKVDTDYEFTHIKSGRGFNGTRAKTLNTALDSLVSVIETKTPKIFYEYINKIDSVEDHIKERREEKIHRKKEGDRRFKTIQELRKIIPVKIDFCKLTLLGQRMSIDIIGLDEKLKKTYRLTYKDDMSMKDFITQEFGEDVAEMVKSVL